MEARADTTFNLRSHLLRLARASADPSSWPDFGKEVIGVSDRRISCMRENEPSGGLVHAQKCHYRHYFGMHPQHVVALLLLVKSTKMVDKYTNIFNSMDKSHDRWVVFRPRSHANDHGPFSRAFLSC